MIKFAPFFFSALQRILNNVVTDKAQRGNTQRTLRFASFSVDGEAVENSTATATAQCGFSRIRSGEATSATTRAMREATGSAETSAEA